ncbi:MAG: DNA polymerase III subunit delta [Candidatus Accumulibacter sp.]|jgi:DNA polymerase-3 subunit delta|nr:DNA polymerase III subunit delta [Accumulibacter sp.]
MRLRGDQLASHLEHKLRPLYAVYGDDPLLVIEACDAIRASARRQGFDEREILTVLPDFNWSALIHAAANLSLFGGRKLIDLRVPTGKPGREGGEAIRDYCKSPSSDALLLVTLPTLDWTEEKAAWLNAFDESGVIVKSAAPAFHELPEWIAGRLKRQGQQTGREGLHFIAERVQGNLLAAHQEILKLGLLYPPGQLASRQVRDAVLDVARYDIDDLREALLAGDAGRLARALEGLKQEGEALPLVLWAMTEEIRALCHVCTGIDSGRPLDFLLKEARVWGARQTAFRRAVQRISVAAARAALADASNIDQLFKGIGTGDAWNRLLRLGLRFCPAAASAGFGR